MFCAWAACFTIHFDIRDIKIMWKWILSNFPFFWILALIPESGINSPKTGINGPKSGINDPNINGPKSGINDPKLVLMTQLWY